MYFHKDLAVSFVDWAAKKGMYFMRDRGGIGKIKNNYLQTSFDESRGVRAKLLSKSFIAHSNENDLMMKSSI